MLRHAQITVEGMLRQQALPARRQQQALPAMARNFGLAVFCMYALLALAFRSYVQPAIVVGTVGYAVGTPIGCLMGNALKSWF